MSAPWPCWRCAQPSVQHLLHRGYCAACWTTFVEEHISPEHLPATGLLVSSVPTVNGLAPCRCARCGATCTDAPGTSCAWCCWSLVDQQRHQAELVLTAPDIDVDDVRYEPMMRGWADRLRTAVDAELVTKADARTTWQRARRREVARAA